MNTAVIYYSKSGTTEKIAKKIQEKTGADLYLVEPGKATAGIYPPLPLLQEKS